MDLLDFFRGRRPFGQMLRLAARLPPHSHYKADLAQDSRYATALLELEESGAPREPALTGWTPEVAILADLVDRITALWASERVPPYPRPRTALDKARARAFLTRHQQRVRMLIRPPTDSN